MATRTCRPKGSWLRRGSKSSSSLAVTATRCGSAKAGDARSVGPRLRQSSPAVLPCSFDRRAGGLRNSPRTDTSRAASLLDSNVRGGNRSLVTKSQNWDPAKTRSTSRSSSEASPPPKRANHPKRTDAHCPSARRVPQPASTADESSTGRPAGEDCLSRAEGQCAAGRLRDPTTPGGGDAERASGPRLRDRSSPRDVRPAARARRSAAC